MRGMVRAVAATVIFAAVHSLLASLPAKRLAMRLLGHDRQRAIYRPLFILQSLGTFLLLVIYLRSLPGRVLYQIRGPLAWAMRVGQALGLIHALYAALQIGIPRMAGLTSLLAWLGGAPVPPVPEAQGPAPGEAGQLRIRGPFIWSRHPLNFSPVPLFWLAPRMTLRRFSFNLVATLYLVVGSVHEEVRLQATYGTTYEAYRRSGVPFFVPRLSSPSQRSPLEVGSPAN